MLKLQSTTKTSEVQIDSLEKAKQYQEILAKHGIKVNIVSNAVDSKSTVPIS